MIQESGKKFCPETGEVNTVKNHSLPQTIASIQCNHYRNSIVIIQGHGKSLRFV